MKKKSEKYSNNDLKVIINNEGIGYAIMNYCGPSDFKDPEVSKLWKEAKQILDRIQEIADNSEESGDDII